MRNLFFSSLVKTMKISGWAKACKYRLLSIDYADFKGSNFAGIYLSLSARSVTQREILPGTLSKQ
jgi:hypothetical protein